MLEQLKRFIQQRKEKKEARQRQIEEENRLERLRRAHPNIDFCPVQGCDQIQYKVVGESFHKKEILSLGSVNPDYKADKSVLYKKGFLEKPVYEYDFERMSGFLVPEPDNPHDPDAVKVMVKGVHVGYIKATQAAGVKKLIESNRIRRIQASVRGGPNRMVHTGGQYFEGKIPTSALRVERSNDDFSVTLFIDILV